LFRIRHHASFSLHYRHHFGHAILSDTFSSRSPTLCRARLSNITFVAIAYTASPDYSFPMTFNFIASAAQWFYEMKRFLRRRMNCRDISLAMPIERSDDADEYITRVMSEVVFSATATWPSRLFFDGTGAHAENLKFFAFPHMTPAHVNIHAVTPSPRDTRCHRHDKQGEKFRRTGSRHHQKITYDEFTGQVRATLYRYASQVRFDAPNIGTVSKSRENVNSQCIEGDAASLTRRPCWSLSATLW